MYTFTMYDMHIGYYWNRKTFTSVSAFLQVMSQLTFWLISITERTTVVYSIFFIVLEKVFVVTLYQRRLYKESRNFTLIRGTVLWILDIPKVLFKQPSLIHPVVRYSCWKDWKAESSFIIEECFARVNKRLAYMSFNIKVQKLISIIIAHKHCHQTPGM